MATLLLSFGVFGCVQPALAGQEDDPADSDESIGVYVTSLRDFDTSAGSFGVDYWVWSVHQPGRDPLEDLEFVNAKQVDLRLDQTDQRGDVSWSRRKVRATVLHDWNLSNFPFDRQVLRMDLRVADRGGEAYRIDEAGSGYDEDMRLDGWSVSDYRIEERAKGYATAFGDPDATGGTSDQQILVTIELQRDNVTGFFKLVSGVWAAVAIMLLSFVMLPDQGTLFSGRMAVLVGALFATVLSMRASDVLLGSYDELSLVDRIHVAAMVFIFAAALAAVLSRRTCEAGKHELARRRDRTLLLWFAVAFALVNVLLVALAIAVG